MADTPQSARSRRTRQPSPSSSLKINLEDAADNYAPAARGASSRPTPSPTKKQESPLRTGSSIGSPTDIPRSPAAGTIVNASTARSLWPFVVTWINFYCAADFTMQTIVEELKKGLVLCWLLECLVPNLEPEMRPYTGQGLHQRPMVKRHCIANIERALSAAWRRGVHATNMCSAEDFYEGRLPRVARCLAEFFQSLQIRGEVVARARENMRAMNSILSRFGRALSDQTKDDPIGFGNFVVADFTDGTRIMILLRYFGYGTDDDVRKIIGTPQDLKQVEENAAVLEKVLLAANCPILLPVAEWAAPPGSLDTLIFQLDLIWLSHASCENWQGLENSRPAHQQPGAEGNALEGLTFKDGASLAAEPGEHQLALVSEEHTLRNVGLATSATESALWKAGDDPKNLQALHAFREGLYNNFENLQDAFDAFDAQSTCSLTLSEFQWGCKAIGFEGNPKQLFRRMDVKNSGRIDATSFLELNSLPAAPKARQDKSARLDSTSALEYTMLQAFMTKVVDAFGSLEEGFKRFSSSANGSTREMLHADLQRLCYEVGLKCNTLVLFSKIDSNHSGRISIIELLKLNSLIRLGGTLHIPLQPTPLTEEDDQSNLNLLRDFTAVLYNTFEDLDEAFNAFDISKLGRLSLSNFQSGVRSLAFQGDTKKLFVIMDAERGGNITREEFLSLDRLPRCTSALELLGEEESSDSPFILVTDIRESGEDEEVEMATLAQVSARFPGCAEERAWLLQEDRRRNRQLIDDGDGAVAEKNEEAAFEAAKAVEDDFDMQLKTDFPGSLSRIQGTTSIDARVVLADCSQRHIFVQTAVVDRTGSGSNAADDAALVVELRDRQRGTVCAHIDASKISSINQMSPGAFSEPYADVAFVITLGPRALLVGDADALFYPDESGALCLHVIVGPSAWQRRDGIRFFDELRILMHFVANGVTAAATSIGAAAGAAASAVTRRRNRESACTNPTKK